MLNGDIHRISMLNLRVKKLKMPTAQLMKISIIKLSETD
nr:MAG TPA: hypothetical protein [Caudoviricetes sp.]